MDESSRISFKSGELSACFTHLQGLVVLRPLISANYRLNFNPGFFFSFESIFAGNFLCTFTIIQSSYCRQKELNGISFFPFTSKFKFRTNPLGYPNPALNVLNNPAQLIDVSDCSSFSELSLQLWVHFAQQIRQ